MATSIVGEEFDEFVFDQIKQRQSTQGSGLNGSQRSSEDLQYLSNKNAWVKLASSVEVFDGKIDLAKDFSNALSQLKPGQEATINYPDKNSGRKKLEKLGIENPENYFGVKLAQNSILFNSFSSFSTNEEQESQYLQRYGVTKTTNLWNSNSLYGIGGTKYGITPPPGILDAKIKSLNRGSIREATVSLKAYNKFQFELIEMLYLRLGFTMMLEWGWDKYINKDGSLKSMGNTIIEDKWFSTDSISQRKMLSIIQDYRSKYEGNYDAFFGKVKNFSWKFNSNGEYDITIDLITLGDVIESLNVISSPPLGVETIETEEDKIKSLPKIESETFNNLKDKPIVKSATLNSIGYFLYDKILTYNWADPIDKNFYSLKENINKTNIDYNDSDDVTFERTGVTKNTKNNKIQYPLWEGSNDQYSYYIRLGHFLQELKRLVVPIVKNGGDANSPQIDFDTSPIKNRSSYFPNQISLDPRVCLIQPSITDYGLYSKSINDGKDVEGIITPKYLNPLEGYTQRDNYDSYGKIMNIYLNFNFISQLVSQNQSKNNEFTLFKFLKSLCNGLNGALGNLNKLEPIIKDDYYISIIDQTYSKPSTNSKDIVDLEVYGYNPSNLSSNFVKSINFQTKISPDLASMISIGATAGGNTVGMDSTAFSKWSEGLIDRFTKDIVYPNKIEDPNSDTNISKKVKEKYKSDFGTFQLVPKNSESGIGYRRIISYKGIGENSKEGEILTFEEFLPRAIEYDQQRKENGQYTEKELTSLLNKNYAYYLLNSFGGTFNSIKTYKESKKGGGFFSPNAAVSYDEEIINKSIGPWISKYSKFDEIFIQKGKAAYNNYIKDLNNKAFRDNSNPSTLVGFLPLEFSLNLDGISGIKQYNKLNIQTNFLPYNYPESLKFLIKTVDHSISQNSWETSLNTLSIPNSVSPMVESQTNFPPIDSKPSPDNGAPFLILDGRNNDSFTSVDNILQELNPAAREQFSKFFQILKERYSGYRVKINSINRSWEEQAKLKNQNPKNAPPGRSKHNYGMAIDMNIITPQSTTNRTLMKRNRTPWLEEGIPIIAEEAGLMWGGNFSNYVDCIHFYVNFDLNRTYNNTINSQSNLLFMDSPLTTSTFGPQYSNIDPTKIKIIK